MKIAEDLSSMSPQFSATSQHAKQHQECTCLEVNSSKSKYMHNVDTTYSYMSSLQSLNNVE